MINNLFKGFLSFLIITLVFYLSPAPLALANPAGGSVSSGSATISSSGNTETINQKSSNAVIDWNSFNIGGGETTKFVQPNSSSLTVNRVHDMNPSQIFGSLTANGNLVLINPNGVFFEPGSKVDVNGLLATTSNVANSNAMSGGTMHFTPGGNASASVVNAGTITAADAGLVGLVAPNVQNSGVITAKLGKVQLASGDSFDLDFYGDNLLNIGVSGQVQQQIVQNLGSIEADGGIVKLTAAAGRSMVNSLIDVEGQIKTPAFKAENGVIEIYAEGSNAVPGNAAADKGTKQGSSTVTVSGYLDASGYGAGQTGGSISILGDNVGILSGAMIDASGDQGGGNIKIGGDFHGAGTTPTALNVYVDPNSLIGASAISKGNGGNVAIWSDDKNWFYGNIIAEGGKESGNGGFVETSGHGQLDAEGNVDLTAPNGTKGTYLLDPATIEIYGNVTPAFNATDGSISLSSALQLWLDASNTSSITLSYNSLSTTASGNSGSNTITVGSNTGLVVGERIQLGGTTHSYAASVNDNSADGVYTITNISGTTVTLDANLGSNYSGATLYGGYVSQINDKSGNGNNATQSTATNQPLWISNGQNGLGVMNFNGSSDFLGGTVTGITGNNDRSAVAVFQYSSTGNIFQIGAANNGQSFGLGATSTFNDTLFQWGDDISGSTNTTNPTIMVGVKNGNTLALYNNSLTEVAPTTVSAANVTSTNYQIGELFANVYGLNPMSGNINEIAIYNSALSTNAQALINQYQSAKWGVAITGPGNATGESGLTGAEAQAAMASTQAGATTDGYSVFSDQYLVRLSQTSNIQLAASGNVTLDLQGDNMALAAGRNLSITSTTGSITNNSTGAITTSQSSGAGGNITFSAGKDIALTNLTLNSGGGNVILDSNTANGGGAISITGGGINSGGGNITLGGGATPLTTAAVGDVNYTAGVEMNGSALAAVGGNISIIGTAYTGTGHDYGVYLTGAGGTVETSGNGTINITGTGKGSGNDDIGVYLDTATNVISSVNGSLTVLGYGSAGGNTAEYGVSIQGGTMETTGTGSLMVTGNAGGAGTGGSYVGDFNDGIYITAANGVQTTGGGSITVIGNATTSTSASTSGYPNIGVALDNGGSITSTNGGNISVTGTGGATSGGNNIGVYLQNANSAITGSGTVTVTGTGAGTGSANYGVYLDTSSDSITSVNGALSVTGFGASGGSSSDTGVFISSGTIKTTGSGNLSITAVSGGGSSVGLSDQVTNGIQTTGTGGITVNADTFSLSGANNIHSGAGLTLAPFTASNSIGIEGGAGTVQYTSAMLADTTAVNYTFGSASDSGAMKIGANAWTAPVTFLNGSGNIEFSGAQNMGANSLTAASGTGNIQLDAGAGITSTSASANAITLSTGQSFINNSGSNSPLIAANSNWLVYSVAPESDISGASLMNPATTIYAEAYPNTTGVSGNSWFYSSSAPQGPGVRSHSGGNSQTPPAVTPPVVVAPTIAPVPVVVTQVPTPSAIPATVEQVVTNTPSIWNSDNVVNSPNNGGISFVNQPSFPASAVAFDVPASSGSLVRSATPSDSESVEPSSPMSGDSGSASPAVSNSGASQPNGSGDGTSNQKKKEDEKKAKAREQSRLRDLRERFSRAARWGRLRFGDAEGPGLQPAS